MASYSPGHVTNQDVLGETSGPALRVENLSLHYGDVRALDDVSFDVARGSILCLLGSSGSGKSLRRKRPIDFSDTPAGTRRSVWVRTAFEVRTWPPCAAAEIRAA